MIAIPTLPLTPLVTVANHEVRAVPRERPAVMQSPHHRYPALGEIVEENLVIDEIAMDVMQMDDVGLDGLYLLDELAGCPTGSHSMIVEQTTLDAMLVHIPLAAYPDEQRLAVRVATAEGNVTSPSILDGHLTYFLGNAARRAPIAGYINLKKSWHKYKKSYLPHAEHMGEKCDYTTGILIPAA